VAWANVPFSIVLLLASTLSQGTPQSSPTSDGLRLLNEVSQQYANAKSYHIEAAEQDESSSDLYRNWQKTLITGIVTPGGRYRYEGHSPFGSPILVSDRTTEWNYHVQERLYTEQPASAACDRKRSSNEISLARRSSVHPAPLDGLYRALHLRTRLFSR
jgi:hypothetical protein